jgi:4-aminobutyrate aminotransferase/(S)-3-amino-2-methylpropionate transaminase
MAKTYPLEPRAVKKVSTKYRTIATQIPVPESIPIMEKLRTWEPRSMSGQPVVLWDKAEGVNVYDAWGNKWLDFSSGVLVTNAGHAHPNIRKAIKEALDRPLLHHYCFPTEIRANLVEKIGSISPEPLKKVFLLTTGAETVEAAIKLTRTWGQKINPSKKIMVSYTHAFHGRTLGAQMVGGIPALKTWIGNLDPDMVQIAFPGDPRNPEKGFESFEKALLAQNVNLENVCGVISETYQGGSVGFMPKEYAQALRKWCDAHNALLIFDEVQAGFGRTGKMFGFEHYEVIPDLFTTGKGISSSLPLSALVGRNDIMDQYDPGTMTSTHTGSPLPAMAALANIEAIISEKMVENAASLGNLLEERLNNLKKHSHVGFVLGKGFAWGVSFIKPGTIDPDPDFAFEFVRRSIEQGILFFAPVGYMGATIKVCPPLVMQEDAINEGCDAIEEILTEMERA